MFGENLAVNLLNVDRQLTVKGAPALNQCLPTRRLSGSRIDLALHALESGYTATMRRVHRPCYELTEHDSTVLRVFMLLQHLRSVQVRRTADRLGSLSRPPRPQPGELDEGVMRAAIEQLDRTVEVMADLRLTLLRNLTDKPFVTSDGPSVMTNRWFIEDRRAQGKAPGLTSCGALFLLPLSPEVACFAYDANVYRIPQLRGWTDVRNEFDVIAVNEHQLLNARSSVYFRDWADRDWILGCYLKAADRRRQHCYVGHGNEEHHRHHRQLGLRESSHEDCVLQYTQLPAPTPHAWPSQLQWHPRGFVCPDGTRNSYVRAAHVQGERSELAPRELSRPRCC